MALWICLRGQLMEVICKLQTILIWMKRERERGGEYIERMGRERQMALWLRTCCVYWKPLAILLPWPAMAGGSSWARSGHTEVNHQRGDAITESSCLLPISHETTEVTWPLDPTHSREVRGQCDGITHPLGEQLRPIVDLWTQLGHTGMQKMVTKLQDVHSSF